VTWATSVPILVFLGLSVLDLGPMYVTDVRQHHCVMPLPRGRGHNNDNNDVDKNNNECPAIASSVLKRPAVARDIVDNPVFILTLISICSGPIRPGLPDIMRGLLLFYYPHQQLSMAVLILQSF